MSVTVVTAVGEIGSPIRTEWGVITTLMNTMKPDAQIPLQRDCNTHAPTPWKQFDTHWALSLFGTAVGAGILYLPINAGIGGFWPLVILTTLVAPMTYLAHLGLCRFILSSENPSSDLTEVAQEHFGPMAGKLITLLYFFAIYPILLIYGVGITNTIHSFMIHQLGMAAIPRGVLALLSIMSLMFMMQAGERWVLKVTSWMVYPLVAILVSLSLYLIPSWHTELLYQIPSMPDFGLALWLTVPLLVFSFNHSPAISCFARAQQRQYGEKAECKARQTLKRTSLILLVFVMFFVFSCVLTLTPEALSLAKQQNLSVLSYLANHHHEPYLAYLGPIVALLAIISSFFGHYRGAHDGLKGLITQQWCGHNHSLNQKTIDRAIMLFFLLSLWVVAVVNPSILGMIESLGGPVVAIILFIMPVIAYYRIPSLRRYIDKPRDIFVIVMGLIAISAIIYLLINKVY